MRASILLGLSLCVALTQVPAVSQMSESVGAVRAHIEGIEIPAISNAPFTARIVVTWNEPLVGGGTASRKYYTLVARDSQGRVRRETRAFVPADSNAEPPLRSFTILDPVSATRTICTRASLNCATTTFRPSVISAVNAGGVPSGGENAKILSLGRQTMNDLPVIGTRETASNLAGSRGSSRIAVSYTERWYSPDLQMDLSVVRNTPQLGEVQLKVTDLVRGEPETSWFSVPSGYEARGGPAK